MAVGEYVLSSSLVTDEKRASSATTAVSVSLSVHGSTQGPSKGGSPHISTKMIVTKKYTWTHRENRRFLLFLFGLFCLFFLLHIPSRGSTPQAEHFHLLISSSIIQLKRMLMINTRLTQHSKGIFGKNRWFLIPIGNAAQQTKLGDTWSLVEKPRPRRMLFIEIKWVNSRYTQGTFWMIESIRFFWEMNFFGIE